MTSSIPTNPLPDTAGYGAATSAAALAGGDSAAPGASFADMLAAAPAQGAAAASSAPTTTTVIKAPGGLVLQSMGVQGDRASLSLSDPKAAATSPTRDEVEAALAMLTPFLALNTPAAGANPAEGAGNTVTLDLQVGNQPARSLTFDLSTLGGQADPAGGASPLQRLADQIVALETQATAAPGQAAIPPSNEAATAAAAAPAATPAPAQAPAAVPASAKDDDGDEHASASAPVTATVHFAGGATLQVTVPAGATDSGSSGNQGGGNDGRENSAELAATLAIRRAGGTTSSEKQMQSATMEPVNTAAQPDGIGVAQKASPMPLPANSARRSDSDATLAPVGPRSALVEIVTFVPAHTPQPAPVDTGATAPATLAHKAVETVLALVDSQQQSGGQGGVVNVSFKFGHDDLSVRVQLRGGELYTQFRTDSSELRAALADEWKAVSPAGAATGLRVAEPEFTRSTPATSGGFAGDFSHGQQPGFQQQARQQAQAASTALLPELRALRRQTGAAPVAATAAPAVVSPTTSLHLTAVA